MTVSDAGALRSPGLLIGGLVLLVTGIWMMTWAPHWFPFMLLVLGVVGILISFRYLPPPQPGPQEDDPQAGSLSLEAQLAELKRLRATGVLTAAEYKRKRAHTIDAWPRRITEADG